MKFLLDTDICIYLIKKKPVEVLQKFREYPVGDIGLSSITLAELKYGVQKSKQSSRNARALEKFLIPLSISEFDYKAANAYGKVRAELESQGTPIGPLDTLIAAHALSLNLTLITNNTREFSRVSGLKVTNWVSDKK
jgi:tRNA(fMet)-specific endonuclease VapC